MSDAGVYTPYSSAMPLSLEDPPNIPELDRERLAAYQIYERIYWSIPQTFRLSMRGTNDQPIYVPSARTVVNETSHYLLKGLEILPEGEDLKSPLGIDLGKFLKRERFYAKFHTAKLSGVTRGDWIMHITADPDKPEGKRISINSVDPSMYFPLTDPENPDRLVGVDLIEMFTDVDDKVRVKQLRYTYGEELNAEGERDVYREERILEVEGWWMGESAKVKQILLPLELLEGITTIPVYHFKNIDWQGDPYGRSELAGFEFLQSSINQTVSDEELALALDGLGTYSTDAPEPTDDAGNRLGWTIGPGIVNEIPTGSSFNRVEGVGSVAPMLEHIKFLQDTMYEGSSTFRTAQVDVQVAQSGIALQMKFLPTMAKLEQRDLDGSATLEQMFHDWLVWHATYEGTDHTSQDDEPVIKIKLGSKLPEDRKETLNELNNMLDRQVISRAYYRRQMERFGYTFEDNIAEEIRKEEEELAQARMFESPVNGQDPTKSGNGANNGRRSNESAGTEATQSAQRQQRTP